MRLIPIFLLLISTLSAQVVFDAEFESGNIDTATTTDSVTYYVSSVPDIGGRWFYFRISGVQDRYIEVIIENSDVNRPLYSYDNRDFIRFTESESPHLNRFNKTFEEDTVFVAYYYPYNFSWMQENLATWEQHPHARLDTLGILDFGFPMQLLTVTDPSIPLDNKKQVWIHARTHPGETPSSWHFKGIVETLLSNDEVIQYYRENMIFYLIPFVNPEGVYFGRSRTNYYGVDLERDWNKPDDETTKEVQALKGKLKEICDNKPVDVFLNLHSQASSNCTFFIHTPGSTSDWFYRREYQFCNLQASDNPYFRHEDFAESNLQPYFPEGWLWDNYGEAPMALTYETPYDQYSTDIWVTNENLHELGARTLYGIIEFLEVNHPKYFIMDNVSALPTGNWAIDSSGHRYFGKNFYTSQPGTGENVMTWESDNLEGGYYSVYGMWPDNNDFAYNANFVFSSDSETKNLTKTQKTNGAQWNYLVDMEVPANGKLKIELSNAASGVVAADAFRIVYSNPLKVEGRSSVPEDFQLYQNYPNPFNAQTKIRFTLEQDGDVNIQVFDTLGRLVKTLSDGYMSAGEHELFFNAGEPGNLSSGVYYCRVTTDLSSKTIGMVYLK